MRIAAHLCIGIVLSVTAAYAQTAIDTQRSSLTVLVFKSGLFSAFGDNHEVQAPIASGTVNMQPAASIELTVQSRAMKVLDPQLSPDKRAEVQAKMMSDVLQPETYPEIRFRSTSVEKRGAEWIVRGALSLHGVTKPLEFVVRDVNGHYVGETKFKQTAFGIKPVSVGGGTVKVKDELTINWDVVLKR